MVTIPHAQMNVVFQMEITLHAQMTGVANGENLDLDCAGFVFVAIEK